MEKKSHYAEKLKGGPLEFFNIHSVAKHQKFERGKVLFSKKNLTVPKKTVRGDPLGFSNIHSDAKQQLVEVGTLWGKFSFKKKVSQCQKNERETLWSRPVWYLTRKNRNNLFGSVRWAK